MRRKKNLNIHDNYKLNEIELQDAIKIAKNEDNKIKKMGSANFQDIEKIYMAQQYSDEIKDYLQEVRGLIMNDNSKDKNDASADKNKNLLVVDKKRLNQIKQRSKNLQEISLDDNIDSNLNAKTADNTNNFKEIDCGFDDEFDQKIFEEITNENNSTASSDKNSTPIPS